MVHGPVLLIFVDGLGWGPPDPAVNPLHANAVGPLRLPPLAEAEAAGGPLPLPGGGWARPLDATLGVPGLPQSATGQTSLLAGVNAQAALGRHLTGFPNEPLRQLLLAGSVLRRAAARGRRAAFLNAYRPRFFELPEPTRLRLSATTVANQAAGLPFFTLADLRAGRCLYQEFTNGELAERGFEVPRRTPAEAGRLLAGAARPYDLALFEYFQTDRAGHAADPGRSAGEVRKLESFLVALLGEIGPDHLVLLTSDHGNLEDLTTPRHTRNPVPLFAWGEGAAALVSPLRGIDQVAAAMLARLP